MKVEDLMAKTVRAAESARVLLDRGDADGSCNRAYYAMFDAARAALLAAGFDVGKTHRGVLNAFNERLVRAVQCPRKQDDCASMPKPSGMSLTTATTLSNSLMRARWLNKRGRSSLPCERPSCPERRSPAFFDPLLGRLT